VKLWSDIAKVVGPGAGVLGLVNLLELKTWLELLLLCLTILYTAIKIVSAARRRKGKHAER